MNVKYISTSIHDFFNRKQKYENLSIIIFFNKKKTHKTILKLAKFKIYVHAVQSHKTCKKVLKRKKKTQFRERAKAQLLMEKKNINFFIDYSLQKL